MQTTQRNIFIRHNYGRDLQSYTTQITRFQRTRAINFPFMRSSFSYKKILRKKKKTEKSLNNIMHLHNQLRKRYYPTVSDNAEDRRRTRRKKKNKRKSKKRKQETLMRNSQALTSLWTGSAAEDRFSVSNLHKIREAERTAFNTKTLTLRKHYEPLKYLIESDCCHEDATEGIRSILY